MAKKIVYCFDIDGVICSICGADYEKTKPYLKRIKKINKLFSEGNKILLYTARGTLTKKDWRKITQKQLKQWKVKYHKLIMGKPFWNVYIDDKAKSPQTFFKNA